MTKTTQTPIGLRSGADARDHGCVPEYAQHMKETLMGMGQTEDQAETARLKIIQRFGESATTRES